jgi:hypothetical protein
VRLFSLIPTVTATCTELLQQLDAAYVGFVVLGFTAIVLGSAMGWRWARNLYFRVAHLAPILLVYLEALIGVSCLLTTLENRPHLLGRGSHLRRRPDA